MNRALKEQNSDSWINGRRRDHGAERAALPVWEGKKVQMDLRILHHLTPEKLHFLFTTLSLIF